MAISTRVEPIDRDVALLISDVLSPAARSQLLAEAAREQLAAGEQQNASVLGRIPPHKTWVDGGEGADEDRVRPDGTILYEFALVVDLFIWIADQLKTHAPVGSGHDPHPGLFKSSLTFYADGKEVEVGGQIPDDADEYVFTSRAPYSRKIEGGSSSQAPDGVFEAVAMLARSRFGNVARIEFTYRGIIGLSSGPGGTMINPKLAAGHARVRNTGGRFVSTGGAQAHNQSDKRFPAIVIRLK